MRNGSSVLKNGSSSGKQKSLCKRLRYGQVTEVTKVCEPSGVHFAMSSSQSRDKSRIVGKP